MAGESILIIDDSPINLKLMHVLLANEGYRVLSAANGEHALKLLHGDLPQLILADIQLPGIDGLTLTRLLKANDRTKNITVVALTAFATAAIEQKAAEAGCDGYITKPIDTRSLCGRIREILDKHTARNAAASSKLPLPADQLEDLQRRFVEEGQQKSRQWLLELEGGFCPTDAARTVHQWIGAAGLLGYTNITSLAREVEVELRERPLDQNQLRESLTSLAMAFY